jgi:hypothetical protein
MSPERGVGQNRYGFKGQEGRRAERQEVKVLKFKEKFDYEQLVIFVLLAFPSCLLAFLPSCPILTRLLFRA